MPPKAKQPASPPPASFAEKLTRLAKASRGTEIESVLKLFKRDCEQAANRGLFEVEVFFTDFVGDVEAVRAELERLGLEVIELQPTHDLQSLTGSLKWPGERTVKPKPKAEAKQRASSAAAEQRSFAAKLTQIAAASTGTIISSVVADFRSKCEAAASKGLYSVQVYWPDFVGDPEPVRTELESCGLQVVNLNPTTNKRSLIGQVTWPAERPAKRQQTGPH